MTLKRLALAALFAAVGLIGQTAQAQIERSTTPLTLQDDGAGGLTAVYGRALPAVGRFQYSFEDTYTFEVDGLFTYAGSLTSLFQTYADDFYHSVTKDLNIGSFGLYTYDMSTMTRGTLVMEATNDTVGPYGGYRVVDRWSFSGGWNQAPGAYALYITGGVTGSAGGSYAGDLGIIAVPEPESWAMLLAGLAVVGFVKRPGGKNRGPRRLA